jgi:hypothetical protein
MNGKLVLDTSQSNPEAHHTIDASARRHLGQWDETHLRRRSWSGEAATSLLSS